MRRHDRAVLPVVTKLQPCACLTAAQLRQLRVARLDRGIEMTEGHADAQIAHSREVDARAEPDTRAGLVIPRRDDIVLDEIERAALRRGGRGDEQRAVPERPVGLGRRAWLRADDSVDSQFGAGTEQVERQIARGQLEAEGVGGRVLQVHAEHQEWRRVDLRPSLDDETDASTGFVQVPPDGLVTIEAGQRFEIRFERVDIERLCHMRRQQLLDARGVCRNGARHRDELRNGPVGPAPAPGVAAGTRPTRCRSPRAAAACLSSPRPRGTLRPRVRRCGASRGCRNRSGSG